MGTHDILLIPNDSDVRIGPHLVNQTMSECNNTEAENPTLSLMDEPDNLLRLMNDLEGFCYVTE
jgi:hypothetical protein